MRNEARRAAGVGRQALALAAGALVAAVAHAVPGEGPAAGGVPRALLARIAEAVVAVHVEAPPGAPSSAELGTRRRGSGVLIDRDGHLLTNLFLVLDAERVELVTQHGFAVEAAVRAEDHVTGLAVLEATGELGVAPLALGSARSVDEHARVFAIASGERAQLVIASRVVEKRDYSTGWEYWIDEAILTSPGFVQWNGAALVNRDGELVGVGHLLGFDRAGPQRATVRTVFVPIDLVRPALPELIARGARSGPPRPWLGLVLADAFERLVVMRVMPGSPAERAGLEAGDVIVELGTRRVSTHRELYRALWDTGPAGTEVELRVLRDKAPRTLRVRSMDIDAYYH